MKKFVCVLLVVMLGISQGLCAQEPAKEPVTGVPVLPTPPADADDATLLQYALQLRNTRPELFAGAQGVLILEITPGSQAEEKGLQRGDIVITYHGQPIESIAQSDTIKRASAGQPQVELQFIRAETVHTIVLQWGTVGVRRLIDISEESFPHFTLERVREEGRQAYDTFAYQTALQKWQTGLDQARVLDDQLYISRFLSDIGDIYLRLGPFTEALRYKEQALEIVRKIGIRREVWLALIATGRLYHDLGEQQKALRYNEEALAVAREIGLRWEEGRSLFSVGMMYEAIGQDQKAQQLYKQALAIAREIDDGYGEVQALWYIGRNLGQNQQALEYYEQALAISRETGDPFGESGSLFYLGVIYRNLGKYQRALEYYQQSLAIDRKFDYQGQEITLAHIGDSYTALGKYQEAATMFQESIRIHETLGIVQSLWIPLRGLARAEVRLEHNESAICLYEQALDTIETSRAELTEKEHKLSFMQSYLFLYNELIDLLQDLHQKYPDKGYDRKALEIFERKQGRMFLEEMGQSGARHFAGLPEAISQKELNLELQREQIRKHLVDERSKPVTAQNRELIQTLEAREKTLKAEQQALQEQIKTEYPDYYALKYPTPASLSELQTHVLQPGELLLVYGVMKDKTLLWLISPNPPLPLPGGELRIPLSGGELRMYSLPVGEEALQKHIAGLRNAFRDEYQQGHWRGLIRRRDAQQQQTPSTQLSHELYTLLIPEEVRPLLTEAHTLHVVSTGPLYALPFEALVTEPTPDPSQDGNTLPSPDRRGAGGEIHYLIEDIPISYLSSASLLKTLREARARRKTDAPYPLLAFAHPVYEPTPDPSQADSDLAGNRGISLQAMRSQAYRDFMRGEFAELPETAEEAEEIARLLKAPKESEPLQLREDASRSNVFAFNTDDRLEDYQYVVFATHGVLPGEVDRVAQPALVLSDPDNVGYLTMADVFQLQLNAKLVSLSACNTGSGEQVRGEGVMGLTRAFMYAGTPAIAVTLWSVESLSAKALDVGLFKHLKDGEPPAQALRSIKLRMVQGSEGEAYRHPYYWAPFVLFGDGK